MTQANEKVFLELSEDSQEKVLQIYELADALNRFSIPPITVNEFDLLYGEKDLKTVKRIVRGAKQKLGLYGPDEE